MLSSTETLFMLLDQKESEMITGTYPTLRYFVHIPPTEPFHTVVYSFRCYCKG